MKTKILLFAALISMFQAASATNYQCMGSYNMKVDSKWISTYPVFCNTALAEMKDGYFCQGSSSVYNTKNFKNVVLHLPSGKDCEDILNEMVDDHYCASRHDIASLMDGSVTFTHSDTCEDLLYGN